jgi:hypothetical protein
MVVAILGTIWLTMFAMGRTRVLQSQNAPQTPAELWASWSEEARTEYVWGYVSGFREGKQAACYFYEGEMMKYTPDKGVPPEKLPKATCLAAMPDFTAPYLQSYVNSITDYYAKYPHDRQAGLPRIMVELAAPQDLTIDQIHEKLK